MTDLSPLRGPASAPRASVAQPAAAAKPAVNVMAKEVDAFVPTGMTKAPAGGVFDSIPQLKNFDPRRYKADESPAGIKAELAVIKQVQAQRTPEMDKAAIEFASTGPLKIWMGFLDKYLQTHNITGVKALAIKGELLALLGVDGAKVAIEKLVRRQPRPYQVPNSGVELIGKASTGSGDPSGHAASAYAGAHFLARRMPESRQEFLQVAANIARSRVYLGEHSFSQAARGAQEGSRLEAEAAALTDGQL